MTIDWFPLADSLRVAGASTAAALGVGLWLGWALGLRRWRAGWLVETLLSWPVAMPPLILGTYLFVTFGPWPRILSLRMAATAGAVCILPAIAGAARAAFLGVPREIPRAARSLGATEWRVFWVAALPLAYRPILAASVLAFARVFNEFAATVLLAGFLHRVPQAMAAPYLVTLTAVALGAGGLARWIGPRQEPV